MKSNDGDQLYFSSFPEVFFAGNIFVNAPVILQYENEPLVQVVDRLSSLHQPSIGIFSPEGDGSKLAVFKDSQLYLTPVGEKAELVLEHPQGLTVCKLGKNILFEVRRTGPAALKLDAEIYSPDGKLLLCSSSFHNVATANQGSLNVLGKITFQGCCFDGRGLSISKDGNVSF